MLDLYSNLRPIKRVAPIVKVNTHAGCSVQNIIVHPTAWGPVMASKIYRGCDNLDAMLLFVALESSEKFIETNTNKIKTNEGVRFVIQGH